MQKGSRGRPNPFDHTIAVRQVVLMGKQALSHLDGRWNRNSIPLVVWLTVCGVLLHRVSPRAFALRLRRP